MFNNPNFDQETLRVINLYKPLADWFEKNAFAITYYGFHKAAYEFEESKYHLHPDMKILKKMVTTAMIWLKSKYKYTDEEKSIKAAAAISKVYEENKDEIIKMQEVFQIDVTNIYPEFMNDATNPPDLVDLEIVYLENKKSDLLKQLENVDEKLKKLKGQEQHKL